MNGTGILRSPPGSSSSTAAEVAVVDDMKESCSQFWLLRFWKRMDAKGLSIWGEQEEIKKQKSVANNAESNSSNNAGKKSNPCCSGDKMPVQNGRERRSRRRDRVVAKP